ncbi:hypothetical protein DCC79_04045 [bacterium]|nr:MAG: hypothetical protein DCC79_04045 [bacterium]
MSSATLKPLVLGAAVVLGVGWLNLRSDDTDIVAAAVFVGAAVLSAWRPRLSWLWMLAIGGTPSASQALARAVGWAPPYDNEVRHVIEAGLALAPGIAGGAIGWAVSRIIADQRAGGGVRGGD